MSSTSHRIAVIGGDGIGPEVIAEALSSSGRRRGLETTEFDLGGDRYLRDGEILSDATLDELRRSTPSCSARSARPRSRPA